MKRQFKLIIAVAISLFFATNHTLALDIPERFGTGPAPYMVVFDDAPVALYRGGINGLKATNPGINGKTKLNPKSDHVQAYVEYLRQSQQSKLGQISQSLERDVQATFEMQHALNAVVLELTYAEAVSLKNLDGIQLIESYKEYELDSIVTDGPFWIGADGLWDGTEAPNGIAVQGEGMVLGIIDSGINSLHSSVAEIDPVDGYVHINPLGSGNFLGVCDSNNEVQFDETFTCNDKLIGAYDFLNTLGVNVFPPGESDPDSPEDENNHGSHVGTTAGGNRNDNSALQIQGVAPRANIIAYDACYTNAQGQGPCPFVSTAAAINQAIADGIVDVINYSIGGGTSPWNETSSLAFLSAVEAGIFVATSGGNSGRDGPGTAGHLEPWVLSVAAATDNARFGEIQSVTVTDPMPVPANLVDIASVEGSASARVPDGGISGPLGFYSPNSIGCNSGGGFPPGTFTGQVALVQRGECTFVEKSDNAAAAGAVAMIVYSDGRDQIPMSVDTGTIPSVMISTEDGANVESFVTTNPSTTQVFISDVVTIGEIATVPDVIADFSSRGPSPLGNLKPEITAPGVDVFAAYRSLPKETQNFGPLQGTSMASPHVAGSAILVRQANPEWSVTEVKSALMSTAELAGVTDQQDELDATYFEMGSGRVKVADAANAGLVLNETVANFEAANPAIGGDINSLNLAALSTNNCNSDTCSWTRTVRNGRDFQTSWNVSGSGDGFTVSISPTSFDLLPGDVIFMDSLEAGTNEPNTSFQQLEIIASEIPSSATFSFGIVEFAEDSNQTPDQHFPVVVRNN